MQGIGRKLRLGRALGPAGVYISRQAAYGTRETPATSASDARDQRSANGRGPRSVYDGPRRAPGRPGTPALRRQ